ncbi:MAG: hypothetical protein Kow0080_09550 [Candidatus Promineifilaceae bacterium]
MLRDRLKELFKNYDPAVRQVINEVGEIEQQFISMERPRGIYEKIDEVITRIAEEELRRQGEGNA